MYAIKRESKAIALIARESPGGRELLAYTIAGAEGMRPRFPGGGMLPGETVREALRREVGEETGLDDGGLCYLREVGVASYYKPVIRKSVARHDLLLHADAGLPDEFEHRVTGGDKDDGCVFRYRWLAPRDFGLVDPELSQFLNAYNAPELVLGGDDFGLARGRIGLRPHNPEWRRLFELEAHEIRRAGDGYFELEHVGSTAVPGLLAKPIIDMAIGLCGEDGLGRLTRQLEAAGYRYKGESGVPGRAYFVKGTERTTFYHVHAFPIADRRYADHLAVRDALAADESLRRRYEAYKEGARALTREEYTAGKEPLMREILGRAARA